VHRRPSSLLLLLSTTTVVAIQILTMETLQGGHTSARVLVTNAGWEVLEPGEGIVQVPFPCGVLSLVLIPVLLYVLCLIHAALLFLLCEEYGMLVHQGGLGVEELIAVLLQQSQPGGFLNLTIEGLFVYPNCAGLCIEDS
jgi:hypothetical protein